MASVTDQTRRAVWETLCDLEYNRRYYTVLADKYRYRHRMMRFGILGSVPIEGAILYAAKDYSWLFIPAIVVGIVLAALTVWDAISNYAEDAAVLRLTAFICDDLKRDTEPKNSGARSKTTRWTLPKRKRRTGPSWTVGQLLPGRCSRGLTGS